MRGDVADLPQEVLGHIAQVRGEWQSPRVHLPALSVKRIWPDQYLATYEVGCRVEHGGLVPDFVRYTTKDEYRQSVEYLLAEGIDPGPPPMLCSDTGGVEWVPPEDAR